MAGIAAPFVYGAAELNTLTGYVILGAGPSVATLLFTAVRAAKRNLDDFRNHEDARQQVESLPQGLMKDAARIHLAFWFARVPNAEANAKPSGKHRFSAGIA